MTQDFTEPLDPLIGQTFGGKYRIIEKLGSGGMGGVYKAEQALMGRFVAIKVLRSSFHGDDLQMRRFQQEAKTLSQLSHPNAVTVFDFGIENGLPYLVMEYIEGQTLKVLIRDERRVPLARVKGILRQACAALSEAHRLGIVHRDIKPDNIMLRPHHDGSDWVKVLDFGVAKSVLGNDPSLTQAGVLVGTPQYMSPEQCKGSELDPRADIYSLGVVLYEMLSGEVPFAAPSVLELLMKVMNAQPESLRKFKTVLTLPTTVDAVVLKALAKEPADRFQTMADFYSCFEKSLPGARAGEGARSEGLSKKNVAAMGLVGILAGVALYFGTQAFFDGRRARETVEHQQALEAAKAAAALEKKKTDEEAARLKADAAVKEAQVWQAEQERLRYEEEQKRERERLEAKQKEDLERSKAMERELAIIKQRQAEMEAKVRESEKAKIDQETERRLAEERRKLNEQAAAKQKELELKLQQAQRAKEEAERAAQQRRSREQNMPPSRTPDSGPSTGPTSVPAKQVPTRVPNSDSGGDTSDDTVKKAPRRRCGPTWCD